MMNDTTMYTTKRCRDHIDRLYDIENLAKAGSAAADTEMNIENLDGVQRCLFEVIHKLAVEALEIAELAEKSVGEI